MTRKPITPKIQKILNVLKKITSGTQGGRKKKMNLESMCLKSENKMKLKLYAVKGGKNLSPN